MNSYPWFIDNWLCSETRTRLSLAARGVYRDLLDLNWKHGTLPLDAISLAKMCAVTLRDFNRVWPELKPLFIERDSRMSHPTVDAKRPQLVDIKQRQADAGRKSAEIRARSASRSASTPILIPIGREGEYTASEQDARAARDPLPLTPNEPDPTAAFADAARYACEQLPAGGDLPMTIAAITSAYQQSASYLDRPIDFAESIRRAVASWRDAYRANRHLRPKPAQWWLRDGTFALSVPQGAKGTEDPIWAEELRLRALEAKNGH